MHNGSIGSEVAELQRLLIVTGFKITADGWFGDSTEQALIDFQRRAGLVADGIAGPKTLDALKARARNPKLLSEADLERAAERLGVQLAALKAVNAVESNGRGFLDDGRPVILYERHIAYHLLEENEEAEALHAKYPNLINPKRGGYLGNAAEWSRLSRARQIMSPDVADQSCSWGQFQIMGFHWQALGYDSIANFVSAMHRSEADQLDALCRFIEADAALHKALKARNWATFARLYNGPAYKANSYDTRLASAYARYNKPTEAAPA